MSTKLTAESSGISQQQVEYVRSLRVKYVRITIRPGRTVRVSVPRGCSLRYAEEFVRSKQAWIAKTIKHIETIVPRRRETPLVSEDLIARQDVLFSRLKELARQHGFSYRRAGIRNQRSRWGSCSSRNNISLNIHLLKLPQHLQDYVILHELTHTEHKNHSKAFWARLDGLVGGKVKALRKELRKYRPKV